MPHMDMDSNHGDVVDYSDFLYQHINTQTSIAPDERAAIQAIDIDPLEDRAGLDVNELAELVQFEILVNLEFEAESGDQDVGSSTEGRGVFGLNLAAQESQLINEPDNSAGSTTLIPGRGDIQTGTATAFSLTDDAVLQQFMVQGAPSFDDETNGPGGSPENPLFHAKKNYRTITGRGPILDSQDTVSIVNKIIAGDSVVDERLDVRVSMVWDIMEADDAGRRFSVPGMD